MSLNLNFLIPTPNLNVYLSDHMEKTISVPSTELSAILRIEMGYWVQ